MSGPSIDRRAFLKTVALQLPPHRSLQFFRRLRTRADNDTWIGHTICDSCNHMPMCGIEFEAQGNTVIGIRNWKEHPNNSLCAQRDFNSTTTLQSEPPSLPNEAHCAQRRC